MEKSTKVERSDKRQAILDAALRLFDEFGFHGVPVPAIAEAAGIGAGTLYRYFPSKEALVNELFRDWKVRMGAACFGDFPSTATTREQFHFFWGHASAFALAHPKAVRFLELHHHGVYLDAQSRALSERLLEPAKIALEAAIHAQIVKDLPPDLLIAVVWGALMGVLKTGWEHGRFPLNEPVLASAEACAWEAIRR